MSAKTGLYTAHPTCKGGGRAGGVVPVGASDAVRSISFRMSLHSVSYDHINIPALAGMFLFSVWVWLFVGLGCRVFVHTPCCTLKRPRHSKRTRLDTRRVSNEGSDFFPLFSNAASPYEKWTTGKCCVGGLVSSRRVKSSSVIARVGLVGPSMAELGRRTDLQEVAGCAGV